jgi:hypothetical protein
MCSGHVISASSSSCRQGSKFKQFFRWACGGPGCGSLDIISSSSGGLEALEGAAGISSPASGTKVCRDAAFMHDMTTGQRFQGNVGERCLTYDTNLNFAI